MKWEKVQKTVYDSLCKINKKFQEPNQNDKNNLSKKIINLIQAFDHSSAIPLGTGLYQHISPVVTLQGNTALHLWWQSKLFNKEIQVSVMSFFYLNLCSSEYLHVAIYLSSEPFSIRVPPNE